MTRAEAIEAIVKNISHDLHEGYIIPGVKVPLVELEEVRQRLRECIAATLPAEPEGELAELRAEIERLKAELETEKRHWIEDDRDLNELIGQNERLLDLVRHQRAELHEAGLLTDKEFAELLSDSNSVNRLTTYAQLRQRAEQAEALLRECGRAWHNRVLYIAKVLDKLPRE